MAGRDEFQGRAVGIAANLGLGSPRLRGRTCNLLAATLGEVEPLYRLEKEGAFRHGDPRGIAFADSRLAVGATALRNMIVDACMDSAQTPVGYPMVNVRDIEAGKVRVTRDLFGAD